jgi:hypothetical protein
MRRRDLSVPAPSPGWERVGVRGIESILIPFLSALAFAALLLIAGCGNNGSEDGENYGNLLDSPGGLLVLEVEHPAGFGRPDCFTCHEVRNSHNENRTGLANCEDVPDDSNCIDLGEIRAIIKSGGEQSCMQCHGDNGVPQ